MAPDTDHVPLIGRPPRQPVHVPRGDLPVQRLRGGHPDLPARAVPVKADDHGPCSGLRRDRRRRRRGRPRAGVPRRLPGPRVRLLRRGGGRRRATRRSSTAGTSRSNPPGSGTSSAPSSRGPSPASTTSTSSCPTSRGGSSRRHRVRLARSGSPGRSRSAAGPVPGPPTSTGCVSSSRPATSTVWWARRSARLQESDLWDDAVIAVVADHGASFQDGQATAGVDRGPTPTRSCGRRCSSVRRVSNPAPPTSTWSPPTSCRPWPTCSAPRSRGPSTAGRSSPRTTGPPRAHGATRLYYRFSNRWFYEPDAVLQIDAAENLRRADSTGCHPSSRLRTHSARSTAGHAGGGSLRPAGRRDASRTCARRHGLGRGPRRPARRRRR